MTRTNSLPIRINRHSSEVSESRTFTTIARASHYARGQVGPSPTFNSRGSAEYAVHDGVTLTVTGCQVRDLFTPTEVP